MLSSAKKLLEKRFRKPGSIKTSLGYTMNTTNNKQEALIHAQINKYNDPNEMGAVVEIELDSSTIILNKEFEQSDNKYRYDLYQKKHPDIINITLAPHFTIQMIYNFDHIKSLKITDLV